MMVKLVAENIPSAEYNSSGQLITSADLKRSKTKIKGKANKPF
jgi:hypothetical protein